MLFRAVSRCNPCDACLATFYPPPEARLFRAAAADHSLLLAVGDVSDRAARILYDALDVSLYGGILSVSWGPPWDGRGARHWSPTVLHPFPPSFFAHSSPGIVCIRRTSQFSAGGPQGSREPVGFSLTAPPPFKQVPCRFEG